VSTSISQNSDGSWGKDDVTAYDLGYAVANPERRLWAPLGEAEETGQYWKCACVGGELGRALEQNLRFPLRRSSQFGTILR
jgi:hypothetical protein